MLDSRIRDRVLKLRCRNRERDGALAVADRSPRNAVFRELGDQRAGQNKIEELVDLVQHRASGRLLPGGPPKDGEPLHCGKQWPVSVAELRGGGGTCRNSFPRGLTERV